MNTSKILNILKMQHFKSVGSIKILDKFKILTILLKYT